MDKYTPREIEKKWQQKWDEDHFYQTEVIPDQKKYYVLLSLGKSSHGPRPQLFYWRRNGTI